MNEYGFNLQAEMLPLIILEPNLHQVLFHFFHQLHSRLSEWENDFDLSI